MTSKLSLLLSNKKKIVTYVIVGIIFIFLVGNIFYGWNQIKTSIWNLKLYEIVFVLLICSFLHLLNSVSWHLLTKAMGFNITLGQNIKIWMLPNISRYIPGIVWQYVGRLYLLSKHGVTKKQAMFAIFLDAIFTFSLGALVVLISFLLFNFPLGQKVEWILFIIIPLPFVSAFILSNQKLLDFVLSLVKRLTKKKYSPQVYKFYPIWFFVLTIATFTQFIFAGLALYLIANSLFSLSPQVVPTFAGIYAGSWILGYISFFAPGGLGVQELSIAGLLSLFMPFSLGSLTAILFRFSLMVAEFIVILFTFMRLKDGKIIFSR